MNDDFDIQAAWLRRFAADAEGNLRAFALRLKEAMPDLVTTRESRSFFGGRGKTTGIQVDMGENRYDLAIENGRLKASVALVVRGITLNSRSIPPAEWFARLNEETRKATDQARALSQSLSGFMAQ